MHFKRHMGKSFNRLQLSWKVVYRKFYEILNRTNVIEQ